MKHGLQKTCPCCGQTMPVTDLTLYPKSAAIIRDGFVLMLGLVQFRLFEKLHKTYPNPVSTESLIDYTYNGTKKYDIHHKNISVSVFQLREKLRPLKLFIYTSHRNGYYLHVKP